MTNRSLQTYGPQPAPITAIDTLQSYSLPYRQYLALQLVVLVKAPSLKAHHRNIYQSFSVHDLLCTRCQVRLDSCRHDRISVGYGGEARGSAEQSAQPSDHDEATKPQQEADQRLAAFHPGNRRFLRRSASAHHCGAVLHRRRLQGR